jgi:hypothetical protein
MADPRYFLPMPPWEGLPLPRGLVYRKAPERLRPPGWEPRKPYPEELSYTLTPEQEIYLIMELRKVYRGHPRAWQYFVPLAKRYAEFDLWVSLSDAKAEEIAKKAILYWT